MKALRGITWNHTRGFVPMVATAQRFAEISGVEIVWEKRSLQAFADYPIQTLAETYDLLIIDHPFAGYAAEHAVLVPLDAHLPAEFLQDQAEQSVGASHESYRMGGHQWALATDAATPVASYREDLLARHGVDLPTTWDELMELARAGLVLLPAIPIDSLMNLYYLVVSRGGAMFDGERIGEPELLADGLEQLRQLVSACDPVCLERNPIRTYDALAASDHEAYCPFAYAYTNYGRRGYSTSRLRYGGVVEVAAGVTPRTTLGGTGLAVSTRCSDVEAAIDYARFVHEPTTQRTIYTEAGGQPGHRSAWLDDENDRRCNGFFSSTLQTHDDAYLRPRYDGYLYFQDTAAPVVHGFLRDRGRPSDVVADLEAIYTASLAGTDALQAEGVHP